MAIEYLDPSIANEGVHVDKWQPGAWANDTSGDEEWQPDVEPPHITDYAAFKKHKHYGQYFKPYRYRPFPAVMYHYASGQEKIVKNRDEVVALGPDWSPVPPNIKRIDMTGKAARVKTESERLAEIVAQSLAGKSNGGVDANAIAATVAAVMAALGQNKAAAPAAAVAAEPDGDIGDHVVDEQAAGHGDVERKAMLELAEKEGVKIDKRWSSERIKKELGLE